MLVIYICAFMLLLLGIIEKIVHQKRVNSIPVRILVNGIRGKSTITRLIAGILKEAGYKVVGKTTGTAARLIFWNTEEEVPIKRKLAGTSINEQFMVFSKAAKIGANAVVCECMAVNPDYQSVLQEHLVQANICVIANVIEDHMDVMGPTLNEIALAFCGTIPRNGHLIVSDNEYVNFFRQEADKRKTQLIVADSGKIDKEYIRKFDYLIFPENISLALSVSDALGIDREVALRGMLKSQPDPGVLRILNIGDEKEPVYFANAFAANDAFSTLSIWERLIKSGYPISNAIILINCREDRLDRTEQFAKDVLPYIDAHTLMIIGESSHPIVNAFNNGKLPVKLLMRMEKKMPEEIYTEIFKQDYSRFVFAVGNIHGAGERLLHYLYEVMGSFKYRENDMLDYSKKKQEVNVESIKVKKIALYE